MLTNLSLKIHTETTIRNQTQAPTRFVKSDDVKQMLQKLIYIINLHFDCMKFLV